MGLNSCRVFCFFVLFLFYLLHAFVLGFFLEHIVVFFEHIKPMMNAIYMDKGRMMRQARKKGRKRQKEGQVSCCILVKLANQS